MKTPTIPTSLYVFLVLGLGCWSTFANAQCVVYTELVAGDPCQVGEFQVSVSIRNNSDCVGIYSFEVCPDPGIAFWYATDGDFGSPPIDTGGDTCWVLTGFNVSSTLVNGTLFVLTLSSTAPIGPVANLVTLSDSGTTPLVSVFFQPIPHTIDTSQTADPCPQVPTNTPTETVTPTNTPTPGGFWNPSFEEWGGSLAGWTNNTSWAIDGLFPNPGGAVDGSHWASCSYGMGGTVMREIYQNVTVTPGGTYRLSGYYNLAGTNGWAKGSLVWYDGTYTGGGGGIEISSLTWNYGEPIIPWTQLSGDVDPTGATIGFIVRADISGWGGGVNADLCNIEEVSGPADTPTPSPTPTEVGTPTWTPTLTTGVGSGGWRVYR